ncbi:hypothetical protein POM88_020677 [Heracleum sosnowskyi]|uniref:PB1-like domain-containing protein n=1 Tax=Heracleum sosnowskyi TaxID=360622 RepID=A0AAD8IBU6_9APIA|nr:hypothetical protein POM88_020677 [Heracleum sosnowskyi]
MTTLINIEVNHHGEFAPQPKCYYIGGRCDVVENVDSDILSFRDLEDWAAMFNYNPECLVYFKNNGHDFANGVRIVYDDSSIRDMVDLCKPYGKIEVYVDSSLTDEAIEADRNDIAGGIMVVMGMMADGGDGGDDGDDGDDGYNGDDGDDGYNGDNGDDMAEDSGDSEGDPAYEYENDSDETEELDSGASDIDDASDEEFVRNKQNYKSVKEGMKEWEYDESDFDSDDLRRKRDSETVPTDEMGKCKGKETSSSETSHFMYQVLGSVGYDALYCQTDAHPWVWTQPPYNKGPSTSPTVQITQARKPQSPAISAGTPPIPNPSRRSSSRLINVTKSKDQGASKTTSED